LSCFWVVEDDGSFRVCGIPVFDKVFVLVGVGGKDDGSGFVLKIPPEAFPILKKYEDETRLLNVHKRYSTYGTFNAALNKGLKQINCGVENLTFYAIRHTWATIAENNVGLSTSLVGRCLNHIDENLKTTKGYIKTNWRPVNNANRQVLDFLALGVGINDEE
ncbi:MAG: hypothetical protein LBD91_01030, partial [Prevotellaceae bacterium]|nr:hypothetical protein [Prevotellaceae bacterium]